MSLVAALSSQVESGPRERGADYFRSGMVSLESVRPTEVLATVHGTMDYDVDLVLEGRTVEASCNCPFVAENGTACKHIWATILASESRGFAEATARTGPLSLIVLDEAEDDDDYNEDAYERYRPQFFQPAPAPKPVAKKENWKEQLATLTREVRPSSYVPQTRKTERQLVYVIDVPTSEQVRKLYLEINIQERKLNGDWSKPKAQHVSPYEIEALADPLDRQLMTMLGGAERETSGYGYSPYAYSGGVNRYRLVGLVLETVLPLLVQTGRLRLRRGTKMPAHRGKKTPAELEELVPDLTPPWELIVGVFPEDSGKQWVLGGSLRRGNETMPLMNPTLIVPGVVIWEGRIGQLNDAGAYSWVPSLRRSGGITVPAAKAEELVGQLLQLPNLPRLELPADLQFTEEAPAPRPRLLVKKSPNQYYRGPEMLCTELSFDYDGVSVPYRPAGRGVMRPEGKRFILRDPVAEQAAEHELVRLGARPQKYASADTLELKPSQLPKLVREVVSAGWIVEAEGKLYRKAGGFELDVSSGQDWFDLNAAVDFDGKKVAFPRLLEALKRGDTSIVLDDGSLGMVPEEWLKKYGLIAQMGTVTGNAVRFSRAQVGVLDALLATRPEVTYDKQFGKARDELKKFQGVAAADPPKAFQGELREYQREGLGWLRFLRKFGFGGCLADDMGLGKTVQVLAMLAGKRNGPALVVVPRSLVFNWKQEAARFTPKLKVLDHTGITRDKTGATFKDHDIVLTTYGTLRNDATTFAEFRFDTCVLDESQAAKNAQTETAKAVRVVQADHKLALSGTPVENHLGELWTMFDFLNPGMLGRGALTASGAGSVRNPDAETREFLARALRPFILRRTKDQVAKDLPEKTEQTVYCDMEPGQRALYDELREHYRLSLLARVDSLGLNRSKIQVLEALLRLRQAACHPGLIDKKRTGEASAKLDVLLPQLQELAESGRKALVFSQFTSLLDIVRKRLTADKIEFEYLDGRTRDRQARVERFQTDPTCHLFLVSLKAGGVGLNLTAAEYVFLLDPWWNPAVEAQAIDRSHRIGQTKPVFAYRLIARGTVEEKVLALQQGKRELADAILGGDNRLITDLKREDLELLLS